MTRLRLLTVLLFIVLAIINGQCLTACAMEPSRQQSGSEENVPPCHRHHSPRKSDTPANCSHAALLADYRAATNDSVAFARDFGPAILPTRNVIATQRYPRIAVESPPPASNEFPFSGVLRI